MTLCEPMGCPRRTPWTPWTVLRTRVCFRILSTSFTSVSILSAVTLDIYLGGCACAPVKSHGCALLLISKTGGAPAWVESSRKLFAYCRSGGRLTQSFLVNETEEPAEEMFILYVKQTEIFSRQTSGYAGIANISLVNIK